MDEDLARSPSRSTVSISLSHMRKARHSLPMYELCKVDFVHDVQHITLLNAARRVRPRSRVERRMASLVEGASYTEMVRFVAYIMWWTATHLEGLHGRHQSPGSGATTLAHRSPAAAPSGKSWQKHCELATLPHHPY